MTKRARCHHDCKRRSTSRKFEQSRAASHGDGWNTKVCTRKLQILLVVLVHIQVTEYVLTVVVCALDGRR